VTLVVSATADCLSPPGADPWRGGLLSSHFQPSLLLHSYHITSPRRQYTPRTDISALHTAPHAFVYKALATARAPRPDAAHHHQDPQLPAATAPTSQAATMSNQGSLYDPYVPQGQQNAGGNARIKLVQEVRLAAPPSAAVLRLAGASANARTGNRRGDRYDARQHDENLRARREP
jgi:hypothetical protein